MSTKALFPTLRHSPCNVSVQIILCKMVATLHYMYALRIGGIVLILCECSVSTSHSFPLQPADDQPLFSLCMIFAPIVTLR